jgi:rRNA-processing protein FCF1
MYAEHTHLRNKVIKVRLNEDERDLVDALARINKTQPAVLLRDLVLERLERIERAEAREQRTGNAIAA